MPIQSGITKEIKKKSEKFERKAREFISEKWRVKLTKQEIEIGKVKKKFDLVSKNKQTIGDIKYYKNIKNSSAKLSIISEYVWLLQKVKAKKKFILFGKDKEVPKRWLKRYGSIVEDIKFYFWNHKNGELEEIKENADKRPFLL